MRERTVARVFAALGALVVIATSLLGQGIGIVAFAIYALLPYALLLLLGENIRDPWVAGGAGAAAVAVELGLRLSVFVWPRGSTAAVALVFSPVFIGVAALPAGAAAGWCAGKLWRSENAALRAVTVLFAPAAFLLTVLGFARPELFPTTAYRNSKAQETIGAPRVAAGAGSFQYVAVSSAAAWFQEALGGVAVIDRDIALLDPADFHVKERLAFSGDGRRMWNWFSQLTRAGGKPVIAQTGGGFSKTGVYSLGGELLWEHHPDKDLPPTALKPADLDGDGRTEFYAASNDKMARLDEEGKEVWSRPAGMAQLCALAHKSGGTPGWVVAYEYRRRILVWDETGKPLAALPWTAESWPVGVVDLPQGRGLLLAGAAARVIDLEGKALLDLSVPGMGVGGGLSVRFEDDGPVYVAAVAGAPRDVGRSRLLLVSPDGRVAYDEVFDKTPGLFKAPRADGGETLFVTGVGLRALSPRLKTQPR